MNLTTTIDTLRAKLETAQAFAQQYAAKLPDNFPGHLSVEYDLGFCANIPLGATRSDADRMLALMGDVFGREGWTRSLNYEKTYFHWQRKIDGVLVLIGSVEKIDDPRNGSPVLPTAFPILLAESAEQPVDPTENPFTYGDAPAA